MVTSKKKLPVSVVVPCFECKDTIERAVNSILEQTALPKEIILVDDASEDGTRDVLISLSEMHNELIKVVFTDVNRGAASARNTGWDFATMPYVAFLDADDTWARDKLEIQYRFMDLNPGVALSAHLCSWIINGVDRSRPPKRVPVTQIKPVGLLFRNSFSTPTVMLRRSITPRFSERRRYSEDILLWQQIAFSGLKIVRIEQKLASVHKPVYGSSGLSSHLFAMEKGELDNFLLLYKMGYIGEFLLCMATLFSLGKFSKRLLVNFAKSTNN